LTTDTSEGKGRGKRFLLVKRIALALALVLAVFLVWAAFEGVQLRRMIIDAEETNRLHGELRIARFKRENGRNPTQEEGLWACGPYGNYQGRPIFGENWTFSPLYYRGKDEPGDWSFAANEGRNRRWDVEVVEGFPQYQNESARPQGDDILVRDSPDGWHRMLPTPKPAAQELVRAAEAIPLGMTFGGPTGFRERVRHGLVVQDDGSLPGEIVYRYMDRKNNILVDLHFSRDTGEPMSKWVSR
jgi:hypothetical protein